MEATFWLARRLPTCRELTPLLSASLERELTLRERVVLRLHFIICEQCVRYLKQLRLIRTTLRARFAEGADDSQLSSQALPVSARERLKRALIEGQQQ
jgi:hypothetical protein